MKKFFLGLILALALGSIFNVILGYSKYGYISKLKGYLESKKTQDIQNQIAKEVKECKELIPSASSFGSLKVTILGNGRPVENLEVDVSDKPGPNRCMINTDKDGIAYFGKVPVGRLVIFFNSGAFPKNLGKDPVLYIEINKDQTTKTMLELPYKQ